MRKKLFLIVSLLLMCLMPTALQAQRKSIAVLETFCVDGNISKAYLKMIEGCIETGIVNNNRYESYNRSQIAAIIREHNFQTSGLVNSSEVRRLGVLSGVDYVLVTEATLLDSMIYVSAKALNVETGEYDISENALMAMNAVAINDSCKRLAYRISQFSPETTKAKPINPTSIKPTPGVAKNNKPKKDALFKPSFGIGAELAAGMALSEGGIPVFCKLMKQTSRVNVLVGAKFGWRGKLLEVSYYDKYVDSTYFWKLNFMKITPFISLRYGSELYAAVGARMNYNFGATWYYGQYLHDKSNIQNESASHTVDYPQKDLVKPITLTMRFEVGFQDETFDLVAFFDWNPNLVFTDEALQRMETHAPYNKLYESSSLSALLRKKSLFGLALNIYL